MGTDTEVSSDARSDTPLCVEQSMSLEACAVNGPLSQAIAFELGLGVTLCDPFLFETHDFDSLAVVRKYATLLLPCASSWSDGRSILADQRHASLDRKK